MTENQLLREVEISKFHNWLQSKIKKISLWVILFSKNEYANIVGFEFRRTSNRRKSSSLRLNQLARYCL